MANSWAYGGASEQDAFDLSSDRTQTVLIYNEFTSTLLLIKGPKDMEGDIGLYQAIMHNRIAVDTRGLECVGKN